MGVKTGRGIKNVGNICWVSSTLQLFKLMLVPIKTVLLAKELHFFEPILKLYETKSMHDKGMLAFQMYIILGLKKAEKFDAADFASQLCDRIMRMHTELPSVEFLEIYNIIEKKSISPPGEKKQRLSKFIQEN